MFIFRKNIINKGEVEMPKRRSSTISTESNLGNGAIGASGSGMSPGIISDLASRINQQSKIFCKWRYRVMYLSWFST